MGLCQSKPSAVLAKKRSYVPPGLMNPRHDYAKILNVEHVDGKKLFAASNFIAPEMMNPLDEDTLHQPLSSYFINSSHNSCKCKRVPIAV